MMPNTVQDYNQFMSGIDHADQMLSYNTSLRKSLRWYKKIGVHMLEIFLYNAQFLFNKCKPEGGCLITYLEFREKIVESLVEPRRSIRGTHP